tara:strand:+ start:24 stop:305 length:282 start_codon:yes stop_codon:yes gene_type:complete
MPSVKQNKRNKKMFKENSKISVVYSMLHEDEDGTIGATTKELTKAINSTEAHVRSLISELRVILARNDIFNTQTNEWIKWEIVFEDGVYYIKK